MNDDLFRRVNYKKLKTHLAQNDAPDAWSYEEEDLKPLIKIVHMAEILGDHDVGLTARILFSLADAVIQSSHDQKPQFTFYNHVVRVGEYRADQIGETITKGVRHEPISTKNITQPTNQD